MGGVDLLLSKLSGVTSDGSNKWKALCPIHESTGLHDPSLHIEVGANGTPLVTCFPCNSPDRSTQFFAEVCHALGLLQSEVLPPRTEAARKKKSRLPDGSKKVAEFHYQDADGVVRFRSSRYDLPDGRKSFVLSRPNGEGGWVKNMRGVERVLYHLPQLIAAPKERVIWIVEGEKKVEALERWGEIATCNAMGAGKWLKQYSAYLRDRRVVILPDNDPTTADGKNVGWDHAREVHDSLKGIAASVRILELPGLPEKGDIVDWQAMGHKREELLQILAEAEASAASTPAAPAAVVDPLSTQFEEQVVADLGIDVLGELESGDVKIFSEHHRKTDLLKNVAKLPYERLLQVAGPVVKAKVLAYGMDAPSGIYTMRDVRSAISLLGGGRRLSESSSEAGIGIWRGIDLDGHDDHSVVIVNAGEAARWNGDRVLHRITKPRSGGRLIDLGNSVAWYKFDSLKACIEGLDREQAVATIKETVDLFDRWRWSGDKDQRCSWLMTGLVLATLAQTMWAWRPHIAVIGESGAGKSTLFDTLEGIFGRLVVKSSGSTAAGIRQHLRQSASVVLCDEFESSSHRQEILNMLRSASRGDNVLRGTTGQNGLKSTLRHMAWIAAVESGLKEQPDKNRFITFELLPPRKEDAGKLSRPPDAECESLGLRLLAIAIRSAVDATELAVELKGERIEGVHHRVIESYAVPASILATAMGLDREGAKAVLGRLLTVGEKCDISETDAGDLVEDIGASLIRFKNESLSVSQALLLPSTYEEQLEAVGIKVYEAPFGSDGESFVFLRPKVVQRHLLSTTRWKDKELSQVMRRIQGARTTRPEDGGSRPRGVFVPLRLFVRPQ